MASSNNFIQDYQEGSTLILKHIGRMARTDSNSGKVRRIMNNQNVSNAACDLLGNIRAEWIKGNAKIADHVDREAINTLINKKYSFIQSFIKIIYKLRNIKVRIISIEV